jgi:hypothetical protein
MYYSIDFCDAGAAKQTPLPSPSASPSTSPSPPPAPPSGPPTGAIVGGVVGGVVVLGAVLFLVIFCIVRRRRARNNVTVAEADGSAKIEHEPQELSAGMIKYECAAAEVERPPVELGGREMRDGGTGPVH